MTRKNNMYKTGKNTQERKVDDTQYLTLRINRDRHFMPLTYRSTFNYYESIAFTSVTTPQVYIIRGNGPYDPNQTGTGLQPVGWDDLLTYYSTSFCVGSRINITIINNVNTPLQLCLVPTYNTTDITGYNSGLLFPKATKVFVDGANRGGKSTAAISSQMTALSFFHSSFDRDFLAVGQAVPAKQFYWSLGFQTTDQATAISCIIQVQIFYDIEWRDRKFVQLS